MQVSGHERRSSGGRIQVVTSDHFGRKVLSLGQAEPAICSSRSHLIRSRDARWERRSQIEGRVNGQVVDDSCTSSRASNRRRKSSRPSGPSTITSASSMSAGGASAESTATHNASLPRAFSSTAAANVERSPRWSPERRMVAKHGGTTAVRPEWQHRKGARVDLRVFGCDGRFRCSRTRPFVLPLWTGRPWLDGCSNGEG
jgi:hypothetical protein